MIALPSNRDENWRYANLRPLAKAATRALAVADEHTLRAPATLPDYEHWVVVDGHWRPDISRPSRQATQWVDRRDVHYGTDAFDRMLDVELATAGVDFSLARVNLENADHVLMINAGEAYPNTNVEITFIATRGAAQGTSYPRVQVLAGRNSRVTLVERHISAGDADALVNGAVDIGVGPGAVVNHVRLQNYSRTASSFDTLLVNVGENGTYQLRTVTLGAASSRSTAFVKLAGRGARCELTAASVANGIQTHDIFAEVEHVGANTVTRELYRGIANDRGKLAFNGKMIVRESALDADSDQSLKSLLTGGGAEAAARPQLEIYTDRVRAKHGATTGKLDEQMLFYMLSRGIDRADAQALLQWAFVEDAISQIGPPALRREIEALVSARLHAVAALPGLFVERA